MLQCCSRGGLPTAGWAGSHPRSDVQEELGDVARDLQYIADKRDPEAPKNLADDLRKYARRPSAVSAVDELSRRTAGAVAGSQLTEQDAQRLTHNLWLSVTARDISERQIESLQNDTQALLVSVGVRRTGRSRSPRRSARCSARNDPPPPWYELF